MVKRINLEEKNGQWKGGVNDDYCKRIVFEKYQKKCFFCGDTKNIEVHHINTNRKDNRIENLIVLCRDCHKKVHSKLIGWSRKYDKCKGCGTTEEKHNAKGYCINCYRREFMREKEKEYYQKNKIREKDRNKKWYQKNKDKKLRKQKERREKDKKFVEYHKNKSKEWYLNKKGESK